MSNENVILRFLEKKEGKTPTREIINGIFAYKGNTLTSTGEKLINYSTIIAYFKGNTLYINTSKYSHTTSKIQSKLRFLASKTNYTIKEYEA